jgi:hypothetical protein
MIRIFNVNVRELLIGVLHARSVFFLVFVFWIFYLNSLIKIWNCGFQDAEKL